MPGCTLNVHEYACNYLYNKVFKEKIKSNCSGKSITLVTYSPVKKTKFEVFENS